MTTTTQLGGYGTYTLSREPADDVAAVVGESASDYDIPALVDAYRDAINTALDGTGITLDGRDFHGTYPAREDAGELIRAAIAAVDLGTLAQQYASSED